MMPDGAWVIAKIPCPNCGLVLTDSGYFQWGAVPGQGRTYEIGDAVRWVRDENGSLVPPFTLRSVDSQWNCGDPACTKVVILDVHCSTGVGTLTCENCRATIAAIAAFIDEGKFQRVAALTRQELVAIFGTSVGKTDIATSSDGETYIPREDWYDHPIKYIG